MHRFIITARNKLPPSEHERDCPHNGQQLDLQHVQVHGMFLQTIPSERGMFIHLYDRVVYQRDQF